MIENLIPQISRIAEVYDKNQMDVLNLFIDVESRIRYKGVIRSGKLPVDDDGIQREALRIVERYYKWKQE